MSDSVREQGDGFEQFLDPVDSKKAHLEGNQDFSRRSQRVEGQQSDVGRAVDQHVIVMGRKTFNGCREALGARVVFLAREFLFQGRQHDARGSQVEPLRRFDDHLVEPPHPSGFGENFVQVLIEFIGIDPECQGGVGLRI